MMARVGDLMPRLAPAKPIAPLTPGTCQEYAPGCGYDCRLSGRDERGCTMPYEGTCRNAQSCMSCAIPTRMANGCRNRYLYWRCADCGMWIDVRSDLGRWSSPDQGYCRVCRPGECGLPGACRRCPSDRCEVKQARTAVAVLTTPQRIVLEKLRKAFAFNGVGVAKAAELVGEDLTQADAETALRQLYARGLVQRAKGYWQCRGA